MTKRLYLACTLLALLIGTGFTQQRNLTAASDPWPPFVDPASPTEGLAIEVIRAAYATQGYTITVLYMPWARAVAGVAAGIYDLLPTTWKTAERMTSLVFSQPFIYNRIRFIKMKDDSFEFDGISSLDGRVIGVIRGYGYDDAFLNADNYIRVEAADFLTLVNLLLIHRIDLAVEDELVARFIIETNHASALDYLHFAEQALSINPLHLAIGKNNPNHQELLAAFERGMAVIRQNGDFARILEAYRIIDADQAAAADP